MRVEVDMTVWIRGKYGIERQVKVKKILDAEYCIVQTIQFPYERMKKRIDSLRMMESDHHKQKDQQWKREQEFQQSILYGIKDGLNMREAHSQAVETWINTHGTKPPKISI